MIGGGATGTEMAAELVVKYPEKQVTLLHSRENLVNDDFSQKFQKKLKGILKRFKVNLILGAYQGCYRFMHYIWKNN